MTNKVQPLEFNGTNIRIDEHDRVSMTDLWKSSGRNRVQAPNFWLGQDDTRRFIGTVTRKLNATTDCILSTKRGRTGGTFAHPQIALAYAKYLSPELHMYVNQVFFERLEENANPELSKN